ncbi:3275_t:CDS:2, partial [Racocetra persica]
DANKTSTYLRHVIADIQTRWNSSYLAWCRLLELEKYIRVLEVELAKDTNPDSKKDSQQSTVYKPMQTSGVLEKVKGTLYRAMHYYWKKDNNESYIPSILDPRVKKFDFAPDKIKQVQELLRIRYHDAKDNLPTTVNRTSTANASSFHNTTVSPMNNGYLQYTSPPDWNLDAFADWVATNHSDDKKKIIDYMKKSLEIYSNNIHINPDARQKADELL